MGVTLAIVALMASIAPAYRAVRLDPATVLRAEWRLTLTLTQRTL